MLINDVDLLRVSPHVFVDAADDATTLIDGSDASVAGTTLTSAGSDFAAVGVGSGHVVVVAGEAIEVDARTGATTLDVSRPRESDADALIEPASGSLLSFAVPTFERLVAAQEAWVLGALGIDAQRPDVPLDQAAIINLEEVERLIALRTIAHAWELAAARAPTDSALAQQAAFWRGREQRQRHRTVVYLDLDGDGVPDATRRIDLVVFTRQ